MLGKGGFTALSFSGLWDHRLFVGKVCIVSWYCVLCITGVSLCCYSAGRDVADIGFFKE